MHLKTFEHPHIPFVSENPPGYPVQNWKVNNIKLNELQGE